MRGRIMLALASLAVITVPVLAGPWTPASGGIPGIFEYFNGGDLNGKYGEPTINYDTGAQELTLTFIPNDFVASSTDGVGDPVQETDTLFVDIKLNPLLVPNAIDVQEGGSYNISGTGSVLNQSVFTITELSGADPLNPSPGTVYPFPLNFQIDDPFAGLWKSSTLVDTAFDVDDDLLYFRITLSNLLEATSAPGSTASISKLGSEVEFTLRLIPEPSAMLLLSCGLLSLIRRR